MKIIGMVLASISLASGLGYAADPIAGSTLYNSNCQSCHRPLATSDVRGSSAAQIASAIKNEKDMDSISLTSTQIADIASALSSSTPIPTPTPTPTPTGPGVTLYNTYCQSCHGSLNGMTGRTTAQIQSAISTNRGGMGSIRLTNAQIADIANALSVTTPTPAPTPTSGPGIAHQSINAYNGPATCLACHATKGTEMLNSLHMKWSAPTPELTNTNGQALGKGKGGINTFCTYAMSSKNACFACHIRADGNAPHVAQANDVDCLMCHSDTYQRKFVADPANTETVTNILGQIKTYVFGKVDSQGNYFIEPDYSKMPASTDMITVARNVHLPTTKSCLRCHATAGGADWTKRGDMGLNSATATVDQDFHLSKSGANLTCVDCHAALNHKMGGRGIDLRGTEATPPSCQQCHTETPHDDATLNRHAAGQLSCQVCHIREFAKGGATEMSRDFRTPVWNPGQFSGQGGFIGEEIKQANVKPEYVWFDGTSYVYNVGETIKPDAQGVYHMAKANGAAFDGKSSIVPIKRHFSPMPLHESGKIVPPVIMWMFMTGNYDIAVQKGMQEQGLTGKYSMVKTDAEMLITHGVDPKEKAPTCTSCHNNLGTTPDGTGMIPFTKLGYHNVPAAVKSCTKCHEKKSLSWAAVHQKHREEISCKTCHTGDLENVKPPVNSPSSGNVTLQGFDETFYLGKKLAALQSDPITANTWALKDTAYLKAYLANAGLTPESHYHQYGFKEGLPPNAYFNAPQYVYAKATALYNSGQFRSVAEAFVNFNNAWQDDPYQHYLQYGANEGINPSNTFDNDLYLAEKLAQLQANPATATQFKTVSELQTTFDALGLTPLTHYLRYGINEGLTAPAVPLSQQVYPIIP